MALMECVRLEAIRLEHADSSTLVGEQPNRLGSGAVTHIEIGNRSIGCLDV